MFYINKTRKVVEAIQSQQHNYEDVVSFVNEINKDIAIFKYNYKSIKLKYRDEDTVKQDIILSASSFIVNDENYPKLYSIDSFLKEFDPLYLRRSLYESYFRKQGKYIIGICPFHDEKSPSFRLNPFSGDFRCFGCQAHGNLMHFTKEIMSNYYTLLNFFPTEDN